jgi:hypothetical protein
MAEALREIGFFHGFGLWSFSQFSVASGRRR